MWPLEKTEKNANFLARESRKGAWEGWVWCNHGGQGGEWKGCLFMESQTGPRPKPVWNIFEKDGIDLKTQL